MVCGSSLVCRQTSRLGHIYRQPRHSVVTGWRPADRRRPGRGLRRGSRLTLGMPSMSKPLSGRWRNILGMIQAAVRHHRPLVQPCRIVSCTPRLLRWPKGPRPASACRSCDDCTRSDATNSAPAQSCVMHAPTLPIVSSSRAQGRCRSGRDIHTRPSAHRRVRRVHASARFRSNGG